MKRISLLAACVLGLMVWMTPVNVGAQAGPATQNQTGQVDDMRVIPPYMSVRDKVMVQREIQQRAAASRNALMRKALKDQQAQQGNAGKATQPTFK